MGKKVLIKHQAEDRKAGLTLADVIAFVQDCERQDVARETPVGGLTGFRGQLNELSVVKEGSGPVP